MARVQEPRDGRGHQRVASEDAHPEHLGAGRFVHDTQQAGALRLDDRHHAYHRHDVESSYESLARYGCHDQTSVACVCHLHALLD